MRLLLTDYLVKRKAPPYEAVVIMVPDCECHNVTPVDSDAVYTRINRLLSGLPERWPDPIPYDGESFRLGIDPPSSRGGFSFLPFERG